uniref:Uncharacterized protein n=1 Tax=Arundo donax TaxID=35708 RepID=A0A0A9A2A5_ARUDO
MSPAPSSPTSAARWALAARPPRTRVWRCSRLPRPRVTPRRTSRRSSVPAPRGPRRPSLPLLACPVVQRRGYRPLASAAHLPRHPARAGARARLP